jgi:hypothetical protein
MAGARRQQVSRRRAMLTRHQLSPLAGAMRHGRLKRIRRALTFYKVCYHFREPYKAWPGLCYAPHFQRTPFSRLTAPSGVARWQFLARLRVLEVRACGDSMRIGNHR